MSLLNSYIESKCNSASIEFGRQGDSRGDVITCASSGVYGKSGIFSILDYGICKVVGAVLKDNLCHLDESGGKLVPSKGKIWHRLLILVFVRDCEVLGWISEVGREEGDTSGLSQSGTGKPVSVWCKMLDSGK
jgi:hypothetical protein